LDGYFNESNDVAESFKTGGENLILTLLPEEEDGEARFSTEMNPGLSLFVV
jgi:hypothetical protein